MFFDHNKLEESTSKFNILELVMFCLIAAFFSRPSKMSFERIIRTVQPYKVTGNREIHMELYKVNPCCPMLVSTIL